MAINKTKAGSLAALAGLAYLASQKGKDKEQGATPTTAPTTSADERDDAEMGAMMKANAGKAAPEVENTMGEDERPAATGMSAATKMLAPKAVSRPRPAAPTSTPARQSDERGAFQGAMRGMRSDDDGGKSNVDRQNAEMAKKRVGKLANPRFKGDADIKGVRPYSEPSKDREPAADLASAYSGADTYKRGGGIKKMASGGSVSSASSRGDGIASKGKTRGRMC